MTEAGLPTGLCDDIAINVPPSNERTTCGTAPSVSKAARLRSSVVWVLAAIALFGATIAIMRLLQPMYREPAIRIARRHALEIYPRINLDQYTIFAPPRSDWFEEWGVYFRHKSQDTGFLILVRGGDVYNGNRVDVVVDHGWGNPP